MHVVYLPFICHILVFLYLDVLHLTKFFKQKSHALYARQMQTLCSKSNLNMLIYSSFL